MDHPLLHALSAGSVVGTILGLLPPLAALMGIIWYGILIYDRLTKGPK